jgi:DNA-directed RNA polymerase subunit RPC12/RpoP
MTDALQLDFFRHAAVKRPAMMSFADRGWNSRGEQIALFKCPRCGTRSDWVRVNSPEDELRGVPCPKCNRKCAR